MELVDRAFHAQYDERASLETFRQLDSALRVLIIDDLDCARVNDRGLDRFVGWAKTFFGKIICFAGEVFEFRGVALPDGREHSLLSFTSCRIREFGYVLRGRLIDRWYRLGCENAIADEEFIDNVDRAEKMVDTVLGRNLCPSHPIFIMAVLQTWEANQSVQTVSGSYGQVYEALIARALTAKGQRIPSDAKYTILSMIAFDLHQAGKRWLDERELDVVLKRYAETFGLKVDSALLQKELCNGQMMVKSEGVYKFAHKYVFYYFTARYIRDFIADRGDHDTLGGIVSTLTEAVHEEDSANILIFLVYLTKSDAIIDAVLAKAHELFSKYEPCDLDDKARFINDFAKGQSVESLTITSVDGAREENRRRRDERSRAFSRDDRLTERNEIIQLNRALKTIQILGQILRNFPGSLRSDRKLSIATETYDLGLRALTSVFEAFRAEWRDTREVVIEFLRGQREFEDKYALEDTADEFMFVLIRSFAHFFIRKIAYAVGSEYLCTTYEQVLEDRPSIAVKLIDTAIRLDHFRPMNSDQVVSAYKEIHQNMLSSSILRRLVRDHLYLYPVPIQTKQSVCARMEIAFDNPLFLNPKTKKASH